MENIIEVKNLSKTYKLYEKPINRLKESFMISEKKLHTEHHALHDVSFNIKRGEVVGIAGKNGSGKSTLLKLITSIITPTSGSVSVTGRISALLELGTGFNMEYTGIQNIRLHGTIMGYTNEEIDKKIPVILEFADIGDFINQPVKIYSSGMFARLAFALAINVSPEILIVDEVLAVGDARFQVKCINKMKEMKELGTTILFVSHASGQIKRFCSRAIWLDNGRVKMDGDATFVMDSYDDFTSEKPVNINMNFNIEQKINHMARILEFKCSEIEFETFDRFSAEIIYEVSDTKIDGFLLGVAILTKGGDYIFGPNTFLEKFEIPSEKGIHSVSYIIPKIQLLGGSYYINVGLFTNGGLVLIDYLSEVHQFNIVNKYFSEGRVYLTHEWKVNF